MDMQHPDRTHLTRMHLDELNPIRQEQPDRRLPGRSNLDRILDGLEGAADDLESELPVDVRLLVAERLRRLAAEVAQLHARDLVRLG